MPKIVVGVDESVGAADALRWALREAALRGWEVQATMAWGRRDQHHRVVEDVGVDPAYGEADARSALEAYVAAVAGSETPVTIRHTVLRGQAAPSLLQAAAGADLLVVGARGSGGFSGLLIGSVSQQCLHHTSCPIAIGRRRPLTTTHEPERIVVGVDGSATSQRALSWAVEEARRRRAVLDVVHAWHAPPFGGPSLGFADSSVALPETSELEACARDVVDTAIARTDTHGLVRPPEAIVVCGGPARTILDTAKGADLVVLGARGVNGFTRLLLGSVSHQVATHAECPVLVVPPAR